MRSVLKRKLKISLRDYLLAVILLYSFFSRGQSLLFPPDYFLDQKRQSFILSDTEEVIHTSLQPYLYKTIAPDTLKKMRYGADLFFDKLLYQNLIEVRHIDKSSGYNRKFNFDINPIVNFSYGKDLIDTATAKVSNNTRGFWVRGELGKKLIFESAFIENQSFVPVYIYNYGQATGVVPGQGRWKQFKNWGYDYATAYGILNFAASKNFTLRLGHGKQKIGTGYRSLLLSDNSFNYPYAQFIATFFKNKVQYSQTYAVLMNLTDGGAKTPPNTERIFQKKAASFQHLSIHTGKYLDLYFFQGMIWKASDSAYRTHLDAFYANPVIFTNLAKYGFNHTNHIVAGGGLELRPFKKLVYYGQAMYDGMFTDASNPSSPVKKPNFGIQNGLKYYDAFGLKNLFLQAEANILNGRSYISTSSPYQYYSHYNQLLTTPALLSSEIIGIISYSYKGFFVQLKQNFGSDNSSKAVSNYFDAKVGWMINRHYNLNLAIGSSVRSYLNGIPGAKASQMQLFYVSLRTSLYNLYYDF